MGSLAFFVYLMGVVGVLKAIALGLFVVTLTIMLFAGIAYACNKLDDVDVPTEYKAKGVILAFGWVCVISLLLLLFVPSQNTMAVFVGGEIANVAVETPEFEKIRTVINIKLDEIIEGIKND